MNLDGFATEDDALSEALRTIRLERAAFGRVDVGEGGGIHHAGAGGPSGGILCYQVLEGACELAPRGEPARPLRKGTLVLLADGLVHTVRPMPGEPAPCRVVRGVFAFEGGAWPRLLAGLPPLVSLDMAGRLETLQAVTSAFLARAGAASPGHEAVKRRLAEALLMQAIGTFVDGDPALRRRLLPNGDGVVHRCLALMERRPEAPWTLQSLAREAHTSRSVLAERFMLLVGEPPIAYLTRLRLNAAARLLAQTAWPLARVAECAGYRSEAAFCRAFRRHFAMTPAAWRRCRGAATLPSAGQESVPHQLDAGEQHAGIQQPVEQPWLDAVGQAHARQHAYGGERHQRQ